MKKYTFEDWLNDKIDYRIPGELEASNDLTTLCAEKLISKENYNKIRKAQENAFDASYFMTLETFKRMFSAKVSNLNTNKSIAYFKGMQDYYKRYIDRSSIHKPTMFDGVMSGVKCLDGITGSQYREMETAWKGFKDGKNVTNFLTDYQELFANYRIHEWLEEYANQKQLSRTRSDAEHSLPVFKKKYIDDILKIFDGYFSEQHFGLLKALLNGTQQLEKLLFEDNGNKLANAFRQLWENQIITGCNKSELERWILKNFKYKYRGIQKDFTEHYLNDLISTNTKPCKSRIIEISLENDKPEINIILKKNRKKSKKW